MESNVTHIWVEMYNTNKKELTGTSLAIYVYYSHKGEL